MNPLPDSELDVLIVGGGFSGVYQLHRFRQQGYSVKLVETGGALGGTWHFNRYPGARVDSEYPIYALGIEELWKTWNWKERYPGWQELQAYFDYADETLGLSRDVLYKTSVVGARFDLREDRWIVSTDKGHTFHTRFLSLCTGFASKFHTPDFPGLGCFKGDVYHTARWPQEGIDFRGKRVGVVGTGASGVQVIQEIAPIVDHLTVFQRTPNMALPMHQGPLSVESQEIDRKEWTDPLLFNLRLGSFNGFPYKPSAKNAHDMSPEERRQYYETAWAKGGFHFWFGGLGDLLTDTEANNEAYAFWRDKVLPRIMNPSLQEKLAPLKPPHPFGCKRPSLEQTYFEVYNQSNVTLIDLNESGVEEITPKGFRIIGGGQEIELDIIIFATGFDAVTGGITQIDIVGTDGVSIHDKWALQLQTYLGMSTSNFPNMFWTYGPQAPTAFCNGTTCIQVQGDWIVECLDYMRSKRFTRVEAVKQAEEDWTRLVHEKWQSGLWVHARSWYAGANIPGKRIEPLSWTGGLPLYRELCKECVDEGYKGFKFS